MRWIITDVPRTVAVSVAGTSTSTGAGACPSPGTRPCASARACPITRDDDDYADVERRDAEDVDRLAGDESDLRKQRLDSA